jgi:hypothetical protein
MTAFRGLHGIPVTPSARDGVQARRWRRAQLLAAGYDELSAQRMSRTGFDLHLLLDRRGRPTATDDDQDTRHD